MKSCISALVSVLLVSVTFWTAFYAASQFNYQNPDRIGFLAVAAYLLQRIEKRA